MHSVSKGQDNQQRDSQVYIQNKNVVAMWLFIGTQIFYCIMYGVFIKINKIDSSSSPGSTSTPSLSSETFVQIVFLLILIIVGFGLALGHSHKMLWSNLGFNLLIAAFTIQTFFLFTALWEKVHILKNRIATDNFLDKDYKYYLQTKLPVYLFGNNIIQALKCALSIIISFSFIAGRTGPLEIYIISVTGTIIYELARQICLILFPYEVGTIKIFLFGGFLGLMASFALNRQGKQANIIDHYYNYHNRHSMALTLLGVVLCWALFPLLTMNTWPQAGVVTQSMQVFSLVLAMSSSGLLGIVLGYFKFGFSMVIYSILGAGVAVLSSTTYISNPVYAVLFGIVSCILQYVFLFINQKIKVRVGPYDPHAFVFVGQGFLGIFYELINRSIVHSNDNNLGLTFAQQKGPYIIACGAITMILAIVLGIVLGVVMNCISYHEEEDHFTDATYWVLGDGISTYQHPYVKEEKPQQVKDQQIFIIERNYPIKQKNAYL